MSHSQGRSPHGDVRGRFMHDAKDDPEVASTDNFGAYRNPSANHHHHHAPDLESDDDEGVLAHASLDAHSVAPHRIAISRCVISHTLDRVQVPGDEPILTGLDRTGPHVRFRSRVRISAGVGRRGISNGSSTSGSPSSSISVPLRTHYTGNSSWGPLGSRVRMSTSAQEQGEMTNGHSSGNGSMHERRRWARPSWTFPDNDANERTHLLTSTSHSYVGNYDRHHGDQQDQELRWRQRLAEEAFGRWPARLLNRHWWWWQLEPILCCLHVPDEEHI